MNDPAVITLPFPDAQARARISDDLDTNLLVEAGAGSGKTTELVARMVALVASGVATVDEIAAVTFTRKAAAALRERFQMHLEERVGEPSERDGDDLICEIPITFPQAALGSDIAVPTVNGKTKVRIPAGTQSGTVFRVKGKGVKNVQGYGTGDLLARVVVEVPKKLTLTQRAKLEEFSDACDATVHPESTGFFAKAKDFFTRP